MAGFFSQTKRVASGRLGLSLVWLLIAISSIVMIEPAPYDVLALLLIIGFFVVGLRFPRRLGLPTVLLGIYLFANVLSALSVPDPAQALGTIGVRFYLAFTWLFFTCVIYEDPERIFPVIWKGYIVAAVIGAFVGILGYYGDITLGDTTELSYGRATGSFKDPNLLGPFLVPAIIYLAMRLRFSTISRALITSVFLGITSLGIFLTFSRGAWGNLAISFALFSCLRLATSESAAQQRRILVVGGIVVGLIMAILAWATAAHDTAHILDDRAVLFMEYDVKAGGRFDTQRKALENAFSNPVGISPGEAEPYFGVDPHSLYLTALVEAGWLGFLALCSFLLLTVWRGFKFSLQHSRLQESYSIVFACVIGALLESFIISTTHWRHFYLLLAMLWGPLLAWKADHGARD